MSAQRGDAPLTFPRIGPSGLDAINTLEFDNGQIERFLGPVPDIIRAVQRGPAHAMFGIVAGDALVGFYVIHPDRRDSSCWWLGWLAIDRRTQGRGIGAAAMAAIMRRFKQAVGCRRVRLLVAPENGPALRLYGRAGFRRVGTASDSAAGDAGEREAGEIVLESLQAGGLPASAAGLLLAPALPRRCRRRHRLCTGRPATARLHGAFHDPPVATVTGRVG